MKYILGWMTIAPGQRARFLSEAEDFIAKTRAEAGCAFFELNPSREDPDLAILMEGFADAAAHDLHSKTDHQEWMRGHMKRYMRHGRFEVVYSDNVVRDTVDNRTA